MPCNRQPAVRYDSARPHRRSSRHKADPCWRSRQPDAPPACLAPTSPCPRPYPKQSGAWRCHAPPPAPDRRWARPATTHRSCGFRPAPGHASGTCPWNHSRYDRDKAHATRSPNRHRRPRPVSTTPHPPGHPRRPPARARRTDTPRWATASSLSASPSARSRRHWPSSCGSQSGLRPRSAYSAS